MPNTTSSIYMSLPVPVVGVAPGPEYATDINNCLTIIDQHTHIAGSGQPITPAALNINADVAFNDHSITGLMTLRLQPQVSPITASSPNLGCLYEAGVDLYYNDGAGNQIRLTQSGGVAGSPGSISNLVAPASASYVSLDQTFVWESAANTPANMDFAAMTLRNLTANSKGLTISPPNAMGADYAITLPALPASQKFVTLDASGNMLAPWSVDNSTITITGNQLVANGANLKLYSTEEFKLNGLYGALTFPQTEVDGYCFFDFDATITAIWIYNNTAGSGGTTEFDLKIGSSGGSFATILTTTGKITSSASAGVWTDSGSVVGAQSGVTKPVMSSANVNAGQAIRMDILQSMTGSPADCGVIIHFVPR